MTINRAGESAPHSMLAHPVPAQAVGNPDPAPGNPRQADGTENSGKKAQQGDASPQKGGNKARDIAKLSPRKARVRERAEKRVWTVVRSQQRKASGQASGAPAGNGPGTPREASGEKVVRITSPSSLLALVPQLMGFEPHGSIVVIGTRPPRGLVQLTVRFDLPRTPDPGTAEEVARHALSVLVAQGFRTGVSVGYGPGRLVTPVADALRRHAAGLGFRLTEVLRAEDGRYWSYLCTQPACCPPEGVPYDVPGHSVTAEFTAAGAPPVLADRAELAATVAALDGTAAQSMNEATQRAEDRASLLVARAAGSGRQGAARKLIASEGLDAVRRAIEACRAGGEVRSDDDAAWLTIALLDLRIRDDAWARMDPAYRDEHLRLWTDMTRRARPGYVAPVASLMAFVAWQAGNGALANVALDRAQADDPRYTMAILLRDVINAGTSPRRALLPMTPEEVAASYAETEQETDDDPEFGDVEFGDPGYDDRDGGDSDGDDDDSDDDDDDDDAGQVRRWR
jgi:hypothetical protein